MINVLAILKYLIFCIETKNIKELLIHTSGHLIVSLSKVDCLENRLKISGRFS